jgi:hypothetical protein
MANLAFETTFDDVLIVCEHRLHHIVAEAQIGDGDIFCPEKPNAT